jgi:hypothetical protein
MWSILAPILGPIIDKALSFLPNPEERQKAKLDLEAQLQAAVLAAEQSQLDIDKADAASPSVFVAGWRPAVGWVCAFGFAWQFVLQPFIAYAINIYSTYNHLSVPPLPALDTSTMMTLLLSLLGLGGMRTVEKVNGVANINLTSPSDKPSK